MKKIILFLFIAAIACTKDNQPKFLSVANAVTAKSNAEKNPKIRFSLDATLSTKPFFISCSFNQGQSSFAVNITTTVPILIQSYTFGIVGDTAEAYSVTEPLGIQTPAFFMNGRAYLHVTNDTVTTSRQISFFVHYNNINGTVGRSGTTAKLILQDIEYEIVPGGNLTFYSLNQPVEGNTLDLVDAFPIMVLDNPNTNLQNGLTQVAAFQFLEDGDKPIEKNIPLEFATSGTVHIDSTMPFVIKNNGVIIKTKTTFEQDGKVNIRLPVNFTTGQLQIYATLKTVSSGDQLKVQMQPPQNFSWLDATGANNAVPFIGTVNHMYGFGYPVNSFTLSAQ